MIGRSTDSIIYAKDRDGRMLYANRALEQMSGLSLEDIIGKKDSEWNPNQEEAEAFVAVDRMVLAGGSTLDLEEVSTGRDGIQRTYRSLKSPLRSRSGEVIGVVGIATDISEQREAEQRERLLMRELDHRAKNMLAVVQSVVALTRAPTVPAFKEAIDGRIRALGRAHSMLSGSCWEGADLQRIVEEELAPFQDRAARSQVAGPPVFLKPAAAQSLALVLHELATNAAKYGALATPTGFLDIRWELAPSAAGSMDLRLRWTERGGREVSPRPEQSRSGFGTRLVRSSIERQLGGSLTMDWASEGLTLSLAVPLEPGEPRQSGELASGSKGPVPIPLPAHAVRRRTRRQLA